MEIQSVTNAIVSKTVQTEAKLSQEAVEARKMLDSGANTKTAQIAEASEPEKLDDSQVKAIVAELNEMAKVSNTRVSFAYSDDIGAMFVRVLDSNTGQVIRQFPSEEAIEFAAKMREWVGVLLDKTI